MIWVTKHFLWFVICDLRLFIFLMFLRKFPYMVFVLIFSICFGLNFYLFANESYFDLEMIHY